MTLGGHVATDADKANANQIAQSMATDQVVANEVAIYLRAERGRPGL